MGRLGVGLYSLAGVYGKKDLPEIQRMLVQAVEWGVTFFDVADQYGPAEEVLGSTLHSYRSQIEISTKVGLTDGGGRNCSHRYIQDACQRSLRRLQTDYLDYYQVHFDDPYTPVEETIEALTGLQKQGYIRHYNIGHLPVQKVKEYAIKGDPTAVMMELSPVALRAYRNTYGVCEEHDLWIIAMGTAGRGLLTGQFDAGHRFLPGDLRQIDPLFYHSLGQSAHRVLLHLTQLGHSYGKSSIQVALNWVLHKARVEVVLTGPSTVPHLQENLGALDWVLSPEDSDTLEHFLQVEELWKEQALRHDLEKIVTDPPAPDQEQIIADLVYVFSNLIDLEMADEKEILPLFQEVMEWRTGKIYKGEVTRMREVIKQWIRSCI